MLIDIPCNCAALREAARHVTQLYDAALAPVGLSLNQYSILSRLDRLGPRTIRDLAKNLVMDRSTLGHLLRPLEKRGLLKIGMSKDDGRRREIRLTGTGKSLLQEARPLWRKAQRLFEDRVGIEPARKLRLTLVRLAAVNFHSAVKAA
jgi:DNA-binding MarR family transcriptional regulator